VNIYPTGRVRGSYYPYPTCPVDIPTCAFVILCIWRLEYDGERKVEDDQEEEKMGNLQRRKEEKK